MCHNRAQSQRESVGSRREAYNNNSTRYIVQNRHTYLKLNTHTRNNEKACPKKKNIIVIKLREPERKT